GGGGAGRRRIEPVAVAAVVDDVGVGPAVRRGGQADARSAVAEADVVDERDARAVIVADEAAPVGVLLVVHVLEGDVLRDDVGRRRPLWPKNVDAARPGMHGTEPGVGDDALLNQYPWRVVDG